MKRLLIATTNPAKLSEYRILLHGLGLVPVSLADLGITDFPEETGASFAENALLKARFYFARSGLPALADDGGLEVDALGGEPGVRSHRWLGSDAATDDALASEVIRRMEGQPAHRRTARLRAASALVWHENGAMREQIAEAALEGIIAERVFGHVQPGFPYRAVLLLPERGCYLAELDEAEAASLSQRRAALADLDGTLRRIASQE